MEDWTARHVSEQRRSEAKRDVRTAELLEKKKKEMKTLYPGESDEGSTGYKFNEAMRNGLCTDIIRKGPRARQVCCENTEGHLYCKKHRQYTPCAKPTSSTSGIIFPKPEHPYPVDTEAMSMQKGRKFRTFVRMGKLLKWHAGTEDTAGTPTNKRYDNVKEAKAALDFQVKERLSLGFEFVQSKWEKDNPRPTVFDSSSDEEWDSSGDESDEEFKNKIVHLNLVIESYERAKDESKIADIEAREAKEKAASASKSAREAKEKAEAAAREAEAASKSAREAKERWEDSRMLIDGLSP
jgi:hypothetical protein